MDREFVDTNIFLYAHDTNAGPRHTRSRELLAELVSENTGCISTQVLVEFYSASTAKLGVPSQRVEDIITDLGSWTIHSPSHADVIAATQLHRRLKTSWWDALILQSALELGCTRLWTEDFSHGQRIGPLTILNPFRASRPRLQ